MSGSIYRTQLAEHLEAHPDINKRVLISIFKRAWASSPNPSTCLDNLHNMMWAFTMGTNVTNHPDQYESNRPYGDNFGQVASMDSDFETMFL